MLIQEKEKPTLWWALAFIGIFLLIYTGNRAAPIPIDLFVGHELLTLLIIYVELMDWICVTTIGILIGYLLVQYVEKDSREKEKNFYFRAVVIISLVALVTWVFTIIDAFERLNWKIGSLYLLCLSIFIYGAFKVFQRIERPASFDLNEAHLIKNGSSNSRSSLVSLGGRADRTTFWIITIPIFWASIGALCFPSIFKGSWVYDIATSIYITGNSIYIYFLLVWLQLAVFVKRLHDLGMPSWLALVLFTPLHYPCLILIGLFPGKTGINKYGEEP